MSDAAWSYGLRLRWERLKLAVSETWLGLRGVKGDAPCTCGSFSTKHTHAPDCPAPWGKR